MNSTILFISAGLFTLLGAALILRDAMQQRQASDRQPASKIAALISAAVMMNILAIHLIDSVTVEGINFSLTTGVAISTLIIQTIYIFGILRHGIQGLGLLLLPFTAILLFLAPFFPQADTPNWVHTTSILETGHLLISLIAYAVLTLAAIHAVMQILLDRALKKKRMSILIQALPSLMDIERHMFAQVKGAACLIAISILSGLIWQWVEFQSFAILNHKVLLALFSFAVLLLLLIKRQLASWSTRIASRVVLAAYSLLLLAYFGVKLIGSWLH